jgi:putative endonuclease
MFHVYILRSGRNGKLYVGHTDDLQRRLAEHNSGRGGRFTRQQGPWELLYSEPHPDRSAAIMRELFLKSIDGSREKKSLAGVASRSDVPEQPG